MKSYKVETIKDLIEYLNKFPLETEIGHLTGNSETAKQTSDLYIIKSNPIGDRDSENILTLLFANNPNPFNT